MKNADNSQGSGTGVAVAEPIRVPHSLMLVLSDGTVIVGCPIISRIICDPLEPGGPPTYDWRPGAGSLLDAPRDFSLDEHGRLLISDDGSEWTAWQLRMVTTPAWPPRDRARSVEVTAYFSPIPRRIAVLTEADLTHVSAKPPSAQG